MSDTDLYAVELTRARESAARHQVAGLDLFGVPDRRAPLTAPSAEQRALPLPQSVAGDYQRWRQTELALLVMDTMRTLARRWLAIDPDRKIGARLLWDMGRKQWIEERCGMWPDNRLQADACRELEDTTPDLKGRLRFRHRKEAA